MHAALRWNKEYAKKSRNPILLDDSICTTFRPCDASFSIRNPSDKRLYKLSEMWPRRARVRSRRISTLPHKN